MKLQEVYIKNFRNFTECRVSLEGFNVIIGPNNVGKTNFLAALEKVFSPRHPRNVLIDNLDFRDASKPFIVEVTIGDLDEDDLAMFFHPAGLVNPSNGTVKIRFVAEWSEQERDVISECYFVREDLPEEEQKIADFTWGYKQYFPLIVIPAHREAQREISFTRGSSLRGVVTNLAGDFVKPLETLKRDCAGLIARLQRRTQHLGDPVREIVGCLANTLKQWLATLKTDFAEIVYDEEASKQWEEGLNAFVDKWNGLLDQLDAKVGAANIPQEERNSLSQIISQLEAKTGTLIRRCQTQITLSVVRREMQHTQEFQRIAREFVAVLETIMPEVQLEVRLFPPQDEEILSRLAIELGGFPVSAHGSGYQSSFVLGARILNAILQIQQQTRRQIRNCVLAVEEPEAHWHPHSQRFLIRGLKRLQRIWAEQFHIQVQFIITTHSSHIVSRTDFTDLLIFPAHHGEVRPKRVPKDALGEIAQKLEPQDVLRQRKVYSGMRRWMDTLFQRYPDVFFSRCALLVEGQTEEGALPAFALTFGNGDETNFDRHSITVVSTEGAGDIVHAARVLQMFGIRCIAIYDRDKGENRPTNIADKVFITEWKDFEDEIIHSLALHKILKAIMQVSGDTEMETMLEDVHKHCHSLQEIGTFEELIGLLQRNEADDNDVQFVLARARKWLDGRKGFTLGRALAEQVTHESEIPGVYQQAIRYAVSLATQVE